MPTSPTIGDALSSIEAVGVETWLQPMATKAKKNPY
jgi:hypothetical protein